MAISADRLVGIKTSTGEEKTIKLGSNLVLTNGDTLNTVDDALPNFINGEAVTIALGDAVYKNAVDDEVLLGDASDIAKSKIIGLVSDATIAASGTGNIKMHGTLAGVAAGLTAGSDIFLDIAGTTGNTLSESAPTVDGETIIKLGVAVNATDVFIDIGRPIEL